MVAWCSLSGNAKTPGRTDPRCFRSSERGDGRREGEGGQFRPSCLTRLPFTVPVSEIGHAPKPATYIHHLQGVRRVDRFTKEWTGVFRLSAVICRSQSVR